MASITRSRRPIGTRGVAAAVVLLALLLGLGAGMSIPPDGWSPCLTAGSAWVAIDPGHGGDDPGAINEAAGLVEREVVLDIAKRAADRLRTDGYPVALTRTSAATGIANSPRGRIANTCRALAYVSIHLNSFDQPDPNYALTLWGVEAKDRAFAATMQAALLARLSPGTDLGDGGLDQLENGGLLTARMPAAMVEPVFLSNPEEARRLAAPDGVRRDQIAAAVADGVEAWLWAQDAVPGPPSPFGPTATLRPDDPILGPPRGSPQRAMAAALAAAPRRPDEVLAYLTEVYRLAPAVGIDPVVVVAQSALETDRWRSDAWADHLNPAGIGITGPAVASPGWDSGTAAARAQLVHLYLYAVGLVPGDSPLAPFVPLDPRYEDALGAGRAGSVRTLGDLSGRWATDPAYGEHVAALGAELFGPP